MNGGADEQELQDIGEHKGQHAWPVGEESEPRTFDFRGAHVALSALFDSRSARRSAAVELRILRETIVKQDLGALRAPAMA
jgi:hypothetical protein